MDRAADRRGGVHHGHVCFLQPSARCFRNRPARVSRDEWTDEMSEPAAVVTAPKRKKRWRKWLLPASAVLVAAWLCFLGYINHAMHQPPEVFGHVMARLPMPAYFVIPFETLW